MNKNSSNVRFFAAANAPCRPDAPRARRQSGRTA
jgi:hypothetical protein